MADAVAIPDIEMSSGQAFRAAPGLEWIADDEIMSVDAARRQVGAGNVWIAARADGEAVGFLAAERFGGELHVWQASVVDRLQGQGIGRKMLEQVIAEARAGGATALTLTTFRDLAWNAPFYAKLGFVTLDRRSAGKRLRDVLDAEAERGLPRDRRCAMRLELG